MLLPYTPGTFRCQAEPRPLLTAPRPRAGPGRREGLPRSALSLRGEVFPWGQRYNPSRAPRQSPEVLVPHHPSSPRIPTRTLRRLAGSLGRAEGRLLHSPIAIRSRNGRVLIPWRGCEVTRPAALWRPAQTRPVASQRLRSEAPWANAAARPRKRIAPSTRQSVIRLCLRRSRVLLEVPSHARRDCRVFEQRSSCLQPHIRADMSLRHTDQRLNRRGVGPQRVVRFGRLGLRAAVCHLKNMVGGRLGVKCQNVGYIAVALG